MYIHLANGSPLSAQCPQCLAKNTYHIAANYFTNSTVSIVAICRACKIYNQFSEPQLDKKVIYIDQLVISNLGKLKAKKKYDERYIQLDSIISSIVKKQLAVFPTSTFHALETSYISDSMRNCIQNVAELYACGTKFVDPDSIIEIALIHELERLQEQKEESKLPFIDKILYGNRNGWYMLKFEISIPVGYTNGMFRESSAEKITIYLKAKKRSFDDILNELVSDHITLVVRDAVKKLFKKKNCSLNSVLKKGLPVFRIIAAVLVELSHDFVSGGRGKDVDKGMALDIFMVAHTLPYVDAIFVDQTMHNYLSKSKHIPEDYKRRLYSLKGIHKKYDLNAFIDFLNSIENDAPKYAYPPFVFTHAQLVEAIYRKPDESSPLSQIKQYMIDSRK